MNYTEKIDKYLDGELKDNELKQFENELLINSKLAEDVKKYRELSKFARKQHAKKISGIKLIEDFDDYEQINDREIDEDIKTFQFKCKETDPEDINIFTEKLKKEYQRYLKYKERISGKLKIKRIWWVAAATIALLIVPTYFIFFKQGKTYSNEQLFSMYYEPYKKQITKRIGTGESEEIFIMALKKYAQEDYKNALELFKQVPADDSYIIATYFYSGISYIETNRITGAVKSFRFIIEQRDNELVAPSEWYLGLCYLKIDEREKAVKQFQSIAENNNIYKESAREILKKLRPRYDS